MGRLLAPVPPRASMGPGRKPRKEPLGGRPRSPRRRRLQWGLGENPGRNGAHPSPSTALSALQWGLGENPGRNAVARVGQDAHEGRASMGPGRKPRKEPAAYGEAVVARAPVLQWGLGENPGRNRGRRRRWARRTRRFNGAWAKTQEGTVHGFHASSGEETLQWGLGENPGRNTLHDYPLCGKTTNGFNGAWAKTQEGTSTASAVPTGGRCFNGAWAKTQEGTVTRHEA